MRLIPNDEFAFFYALLQGGLLVGFAAILSFGLGRTPRPPNETVFGCYSASHSPSIRLNGYGLTVQEAGLPPVQFHLEWSKRGLVIVTHPPIHVALVGQENRFAIDQRGLANELRLYRVAGGQDAGVWRTEEREGFLLRRSDGLDLDYQMVPDGECA